MDALDQTCHDLGLSTHRHNIPSVQKAYGKICHDQSLYRQSTKISSGEPRQEVIDNIDGILDFIQRVGGRVGVRTATSRDRVAYDMLPWGVRARASVPWYLALQTPTTYVLPHPRSPAAGSRTYRRIRRSIMTCAKKPGMHSMTARRPVMTACGITCGSSNSSETSGMMHSELQTVIQIRIWRQQSLGITAP